MGEQWEIPQVNLLVISITETAPVIILFFLSVYLMTFCHFILMMLFLDYQIIQKSVKG
jgi:hypothetical protein